MATLEINKKARTTFRGAATRLINAIDNILKSENIDFDLLEQNVTLLNIKSEDLRKIETLVLQETDSDHYEEELNLSQSYSDKIIIALFRANKKLKENKAANNTSILSSTEQGLNPVNVNTNNVVKLPKLIIQKFFGDCTEFTSFWNTFRIAIHDNNSLSKIEKFNYLKSYLAGAAARAIEGFEINESNYDSAVKILERRFGKREVIINEHMNKLLNLSPVYKPNDIQKLKKLHNEIEVNVRSLSALGLESDSYSAMLVAVILKIIPNEFALEYNRRNAEKTLNPDINNLLEFIQSEISHFL